MNPFYPKFNIRLLPRMLGIACLGALVAGCYGIINDQITYTISPEYFTRLKFDQFHYADFGWPVRVHVAEIGFLATWWVGFFSGWFLARIAVPCWPAEVAYRRCLAGFCVIVLMAFTSGLIGYFLGRSHSADYSNWQEMCLTLGVTDIPAFVCVASIHNAGYLGGLLGLIFSIIGMVYLKKKDARRAVEK